MMCLAHRRELPTGTPITVALSFPGLLAPIQLDGIVRWVRAADEPVMGIELAAGQQREQLAAIVSRIRAGDAAVVQPTLRALVVEDNPHVAAMICSALSSGRHGLGVACVAASDGKAALAHIRRQTFDALIVDLYLPILDGIGLIAAVRRELGQQEPPIIVLSAGGADAHAAAIAAGADTFLEKPVRLRPLLDAMRSLVQQEVPDVHPHP